MPGLESFFFQRSVNATKNLADGVQYMYDGFNASRIQWSISLSGVGLVALADLTTIAVRTALTGTATLLDVFVICPGLQGQQLAPQLSCGEYPACAAMTTGYVFRIENQATVYYLQRVGAAGCLTTLVVNPSRKSKASWGRLRRSITYIPAEHNLVTLAAYWLIVCITIMALIYLASVENYAAIVVILGLMFARLCNILLIRRRSNGAAWKGMSEPGVRGDLLILLSQDRWIRMQGLVDDLKSVASGQWLREMTFVESSVSSIATLLVYIDVALSFHLDQVGQVVLLLLLTVSVGLLAVVNEQTDSLTMNGKDVRVEGQPVTYKRRLDLANQLVDESGRNDWAIRLGLIVPQTNDPKSTSHDAFQEEVTM